MRVYMIHKYYGLLGEPRVVACVSTKEEMEKTSKITILSVGWMLSKLILAVSCHTPVSEVYALYE